MHKWVTNAPAIRKRESLARSTMPGAPSRSRAGPQVAHSPYSMGALNAFIATATQEVLAATYWFDPATDRTTGSVTVRLLGHRQGAGAKPRAGDQFVRDEQVQGVLPDSGPVSITSWVRGINPGEWVVSARVLAPDSGGRSYRGRRDRTIAAPQLYPGGWSWRRWSVHKRPPQPLKTCLLPMAQVPGVVPLIWAAMAIVGVVLALATQQAILSRADPQIANAWAVSLVAIAAGIVGAKVRFMVTHRREGRFEGWSVQGFLAGLAIAGPAALAIAQIPIGLFVDVSTPGLFLGLAVGRIGCFFAGCCVGRPTTARWGLWSSDRRVGIRRIPTQLLESALALAIALAALAALLGDGSLRGGIFVAALALYTFFRQGILRLRAERPQSVRGGAIVAAAALVVLLADIVSMALGL